MIISLELLRGWEDFRSWSLPYPADAAEDEEQEENQDEDAPARHCCMGFWVGCAGGPGEECD